MLLARELLHAAENASDLRGSDPSARRTAPSPCSVNREQDQLQYAVSSAVTAGEHLRRHLLCHLRTVEKGALLGCVVGLHCLHHILKPVVIGTPKWDGGPPITTVMPEVLVEYADAS